MIAKLIKRIFVSNTYITEDEMIKEYIKMMAVTGILTVYGFLTIGCRDLNIDSERKQIRIEQQETEGDTNINENGTQKVDRRVVPTPVATPVAGANAGGIVALLGLSLLLTGGCVGTNFNLTASLYNRGGNVGGPTSKDAWQTGVGMDAVAEGGGALEADVAIPAKGPLEVPPGAPGTQAVDVPVETP
jgi:hypothetical protein